MNVGESRIIPTEEKYVEGFRDVVDVVARERRYIALLEGVPIDSARAFVRSIHAGGGVSLVVVDGRDEVIGWCDIVRNPREGFRHCGTLGMGLLANVRGRGLGDQLARAAIERAWDAGIERIELDVFASNERAISLYRKLGFVVEGVKRRMRKIDGSYDDNVMMALLRE